MAQAGTELQKNSPVKGRCFDVRGSWRVGEYQHLSTEFDLTLGPEVVRDKAWRVQGFHVDAPRSAGQPRQIEARLLFCAREQGVLFEKPNFKRKFVMTKLLAVLIASVFAASGAMAQAPAKKDEPKKEEAKKDAKKDEKKADKK